jgi:hypothetical protein
MKSFEESLPAASAEWVEAGLISAAQREAILARHAPAERDGSRFVAVLATAGGLLLAIGISLVIKANWQALGDWVKILGLVALLAGAYFAGWRLKTRGFFPKTGDAFLMVGCLLFLAGIALVSQIFHLNSRPASGLLIWWLGIVALPWLTRSKGAQMVSLAACLLWTGYEMATPGSPIALDMDEHAGFLPFYFALGLAIWLFGMALRGSRFDDFAAMHETWGFLLAGGALYWLGFFRHIGFSGSGGPWRDGKGALLFSALLLAAAAIAAAWRNRRESKSLWPWLLPALLPMVAAGTGLDPDGEGVFVSAAAWLSLFALSVAVIRIGLATERPGWVNLGIAFVGLNIVTRYFDLFADLLEGGLFFMVSGVLLIALGILLEKKRRSLLAEMEAGP